MFLLLCFVLLIKSTVAFIGYDCGSRTLNITTLSLLEVAPCEIPPSNLNVTNQYIQLLQINEFLETTAISCKIIIHRNVFYCGMSSHNSNVRHGEMEYIYDISKEACQQLHNTGVFNFDNTHIISGVKLNRTVVHPIVFAGYLNDEGKCNGGAYADPYGSWEDVIVQGTIKILITEHSARVKLDQNKIYLTSGTSCTLSEGTCIDTEGGYTYWNTIPRDSCKFNHYSILYEGLANKIEDLDKDHSHTVYSLSTQDITFALASKSYDSVCGYKIVKTEHPRLVIFETIRGESFAKREKLAVSNLDIFTYINSKFIYVEKHIKMQIKRLYIDALMQRCNIERETLKNALAIATQAPDQFAYNLMKGPGYMAVTAGEVVHIVKCIPVDVKLSHGDNCYAELQVSRNNITQFLTPRTHILKYRGTKVNCNTLLAPHYFIEENWYKILPTPTEARTPAIIKPMTKPTWHYISPSSLATSGIYTEKDLDDLRDHIMFPVERPAVLNDIAREIHQKTVTDNQGIISQLINEDIMEKIVVNTWENFWEKFVKFGAASAGVITIILILQIVKTFIEVLINGYALHQVYGWSIHLLGAIWNSLTYLLIQIRDTRDNDNDNNEHYHQANKATEVITMKPIDTKLNSQQPNQSNLPDKATTSEDSNDRGFFTLP